MTCLTEKLKAEIDSMDYTAMLRKWRFAPLGDPMFQLEAGEYYQARMAELRKQVGDEGHTRASKEIGWDS